LTKQADEVVDLYEAAPEVLPAVEFSEFSPTPPPPPVKFTPHPEEVRPVYSSSPPVPGNSAPPSNGAELGAVLEEYRGRRYWLATLIFLVIVVICAVGMIIGINSGNKVIAASFGAPGAGLLPVYW
jgi:hypothetical protein